MTNEHDFSMASTCTLRTLPVSDLEDAAMLRYSRHLLLDGWGVEAQQAIAGKTALVLGLGGLGCAAAQVLASSGVWRLLLVDGDTVELHLADPGAPTLIRQNDKSPALYVLMPMRV